MKKEVFKARLLQIELERDALNAEIQSMAGEDADRTRQGYALAWGPAMFSEVADKLRALQGDIKDLLEEYSKGEPSPPTTPVDPRGFIPTPLCPDQFHVNVMVGDGTVPNSIKLLIHHTGVIKKSVRFGKGGELRSEIPVPEAMKLLYEWYCPPPTPERLAMVKEIISGLGNPVEMKANDLTCLGWVNIDPKMIPVTRAALEILLRHAAGDNERLYTCDEIKQSFIAGKKSANDDARGIKGQLCSEWVTTLDATRKFDLEGAGE